MILNDRKLFKLEIKKTVELTARPVFIINSNLNFKRKKKNVSENTHHIRIIAVLLNFFLRRLLFL